jgi:hypothetical protein
MYVDRRLAGIQAVQTLSRLNRAYPGKDRPSCWTSSTARKSCWRVETYCGVIKRCERSERS